MEGDENAAKDAAPEIQGDGDRCYQNGNACSLLQFDRDFKDVIERDGENRCPRRRRPDLSRAGSRELRKLRGWIPHDRPALSPLETKRVTAPRSPRSSKFM